MRNVTMNNICGTNNSKCNDGGDERGKDFGFYFVHVTHMYIELSLRQYYYCTGNANPFLSFCLSHCCQAQHYVITKCNEGNLHEGPCVDCEAHSDYYRG